MTRTHGGQDGSGLRGWAYGEATYIKKLTIIHFLKFFFLSFILIIILSRYTKIWL